MMALSSSTRQRHSSFVERVGKMLHLHYDEIANEPLPQRWVDLIHYLNEKEQARGEPHQRDAEPPVRRPPLS